MVKSNEMVKVGDAMVRNTDIVLDEAGTQKNIEAAKEGKKL